MESVVVALSTEQPPGHGASTVMILGAAILIILALRSLARSLRPFAEVLRAAAAMGMTVLFAVGALILLVVSQVR
ncbi:hypothetical protein [Actinoplanes couchii]|uniref:Uncharacterized protein n=1 Tax=Actinoplanes couchii TaxID=403638 RepID=A0ABQ3XNL3_9ACTN|nr:hypothetical protein [Actinoplanes couchii]MDR6318061.1 hypothetical protein [Actinoplanes couchii]GID60022.1 hypothetical protein Aco03nite_084260 [Actinoplanes couchii]